MTASARAFAAARQTHEEGKLDALRNAVVNVALGIQSDEVWTVVLLDLVDQLTEAHLVTLALLNDVIAGRRARGLRENPSGTTRDAHVKEILGVDDENWWA